MKGAFILSGAKRLVMSHWSAPSAETTTLMTRFCEGMAAGKAPAAALRDAQLAMLEKNRNPFFWGAFTLTGKPN